jgi:hypothetical protein
MKDVQRELYRLNRVSLRPKMLAKEVDAFFRRGRWEKSAAALVVQELSAAWRLDTSMQPDMDGVPVAVSTLRDKGSGVQPPSSPCCFFVMMTACWIPKPPPEKLFSISKKLCLPGL